VGGGVGGGGGGGAVETKVAAKKRMATPEKAPKGEKEGVREEV